MKPDFSNNKFINDFKFALWNIFNWKYCEGIQLKNIRPHLSLVIFRSWKYFSVIVFKESLSKPSFMVLGQHVTISAFYSPSITGGFFDQTGWRWLDVIHDASTNCDAVLYEINIKQKQHFTLKPFIFRLTMQKVFGNF